LHRSVDLRPGELFDIAVKQVGRDADDLPPLAVDEQSAAKGFLAREEPSCERSVDDGDPLNVDSVRIPERASLKNRNAERSEVARCGGLHVHARTLLEIVHGLAVDLEPPPAGAVSEGQPQRRTCALHAGDFLDRLYQPVETPRVDRLGHTGHRVPETDGEHSVRVEPGIDVIDVLEAARKRTGRGEQHDPDGDLRDHERAPTAEAVEVSSRESRPLTQLIPQSRPGEAHRRQQPDHEARENAGAERDSKGAHVESDCFAQHRPRPPCGQEQPGRAGERREQDRFGHELSGDPAWRSAECPANSQLASARHQTGDQKDGQIDARDQ
jgi:hypothetical protein